MGFFCSIENYILLGKIFLHKKMWLNISNYKTESERKDTNTLRGTEIFLYRFIILLPSVFAISETT
jgi:hypothetical protein